MEDRVKGYKSEAREKNRELRTETRHSKGCILEHLIDIINLRETGIRGQGRGRFRVILGFLLCAAKNKDSVIY